MNFRNFFYEQAGKEPWFTSFPMPKFVGNFLISSINLIDKNSEVTESQWDNSFGRGFPLNQPAVDLMSVSPKQNLVMTQAFQWLVTEGLYNALKNVKN